MSSFIFYDCINCVSTILYQGSLLIQAYNNPWFSCVPKLSSGAQIIIISHRKISSCCNCLYEKGCSVFSPSPPTQPFCASLSQSLTHHWRKDLLWLTVCRGFNPYCDSRMVEGHGEGELLMAWHPEGRECQGGSQGPVNSSRPTLS